MVRQKGESEMIKKSKQINKGTVKNQTNKSDTKKKIVNKNVVYECLRCSYKYIGDKPLNVCTACSHENTYVINTQYKVKE